MVECWQAGWLLTVANLGDSRAVVDTGAEVTLLTEDHCVASHREERRRLEAAGSIIAPLDISGAAQETHTLGPMWAQ